MGSKRNIHTVPLPSGNWANKREGNPNPISIHKTQSAAIQQGIPIAKADGVDLFIHGRDGKIRDRDSYGNDPFPPKDKKH